MLPITSGEGRIQVIIWSLFIRTTHKHKVTRPIYSPFQKHCSSYFCIAPTFASFLCWISSPLQSELLVLEPIL